MRHLAFPLFFSLLLIATSLTPTIYQFRAAPPNQIFVGTHNNALDYPMFVAAINRAQRGSWCNIAVFTSEPQPCDFVHWIYIPLGKLTRLFGLNGIHTYQLGRILFGLILLLTTYYFISRLFRSTKSPATPLIRAAFLLSLFSAGFTRFAHINNQLTPLGSYLSWWTGGDVLRRALFQPHAMLKNTLLLLILALFTKLFSTKPRSRLPYLTLPLFGLLLGLHDPMNSLSILALLGFYAFFILAKNRFRPARFLARLPVIHVSLYFIFSIAGLLSTYWAFKYTPWVSVSTWESQQFYPVPFWEYANHLGPVFYLGIPGLLLLVVNSLKKSPTHPDRFLALSSAILTFASLFMILSGITKYTGLSTLRFFQTPVHVFLSIGSAYLLYTLLNLLTPRKIAAPSFALTISLLLISTIPAFAISFRSQLSEWSVYYWNMYPDRTSYQTLLYLKSVSHPGDVVLSNDLAGQLIPTVTGNPVYIGHIVSTLNFPTKLEKTRRFFRGQMSPAERLELIRESRAKYLITMYPENERINPATLPALIPLDVGSTLQLYQIDPEKL